LRVVHDGGRWKLWGLPLMPYPRPGIDFEVLEDKVVMYQWWQNDGEHYRSICCVEPTL
jgi:hypothetical protein